MRHKDLIKLIEEGESTTLEFKRKATSPYKLAREISALANTKGGYLLIGVDDNGTIYGVHSEKSEIDVVESACQFEIDPPVEPAIDVINIQGKEIVVVYIEQSRSKPHKMYFENGSKDNKVPRAYIRMGEKSVIASREMYRLMKYSDDDSKKLMLSIGDKEKRLFAYLEKYEKATVRDFSRIVNISERRASRLLIRLVRAGVIQIHSDSARDYFTLA